ncbi:TetR/AcrR family transcriptional regulator [Aureitalea marina]|uniref:TetR family transcriptional regulator n=1 Tax=Aureitalea marina TaxID=930804 RepID=A0A2S7KN40_9FLAO|nr:TetR/AcrR family transcriptional regulator [Aureitalea marina]PQB04046.1 TetR family transcriptional regulator [Aureitalea marina]
MLSKSQRTSQLIIEKAAPIFNQKGYAATSMTDITRATGLTKGAIYGNFENKEAIAIAAFDKSVNQLLQRIAEFQQQSDSPLQRLLLIPEFYRNYYDYSQHLGGCPILNIGVDSNHQNSALLARVQLVINKTQANVAKLVEWAKAKGEVKPAANSEKFARELYTRIQGAVFMSHTMNNHQYLREAADQVEELINRTLVV